MLPVDFCVFRWNAFGALLFFSADNEAFAGGQLVFVPFEPDANGLGPAVLIEAATGNVFRVAAFSCAVKSLVQGLQSPPTSVENRANTQPILHQLSTAKIKNIASGCGRFEG